MKEGTGVRKKGRGVEAMDKNRQEHIRSDEQGRCWEKGSGRPSRGTRSDEALSEEKHTGVGSGAGMSCDMGAADG